MTRPKNYLITYKYDKPYPFSREYRVEATNMGTAMNRGFRRLRKDEKGKRITELSVKITYLL
jgi:hypothetical protein